MSYFDFYFDGHRTLRSLEKILWINKISLWVSQEVSPCKFCRFEFNRQSINICVNFSFQWFRKGKLLVRRREQYKFQQNLHFPFDEDHTLKKACSWKKNSLSPILHRLLNICLLNYFWASFFFILKPKFFWYFFSIFMIFL